jgi:phosphoglycolate phosphatase-like HAD superfamily hydrolase
VLFDIDGTLLLTHDQVYVEAARTALEEVYGTDAEGPDVPGDTATAHVRRALRAAGVDSAEIDAGLGRWCSSFSTRYVELLAEADTSHWELAPHAAEAIAAVERRALLTGNPSAVAHARMERLGLGRFFPRGEGAFGCERVAPSSSRWRASARGTGPRPELSQSATRRSTSPPRMTEAA